MNGGKRTEMYRITTGSLMHVYGAFGAKVHYTARLTVRLTDPVDAGILQRALDRTQERYPYFCVTLKKGMDEQGGREIFCYEENPRPVGWDGNVQSAGDASVLLLRGAVRGG